MDATPLGCWDRAAEVLSKFKDDDGTPMYPDAADMRADIIVHALADEADITALLHEAYGDLLDNADLEVDRLKLEVEALKETVRGYGAGVAELRIEIAKSEADLRMLRAETK